MYSYHNWRAWYNGSYTTMDKPIRTLELHNPMIQFLIINIVLVFQNSVVDTFTLSSGADAEFSDPRLFVSILLGEDSPTCGSLRQPCQTLFQALIKVVDGGKIFLDGRHSGLRPYNCRKRIGKKERIVEFMRVSLTIQGWLTKAHISCKLRYGLVFEHDKNQLLRITFSNLVFHNKAFVLNEVSCFNIAISNCKIINCSAAVVVAQGESGICTNSSIVISDTEFLNNTQSLIANLSNGIFILKISRSVFQDRVGRFKVTSEDRYSTGAVYIKAPTLRNMVHVSCFVTDSIFRELGHKLNGFALSFKVNNLFTTGMLSVSNTTFLNNENSIFVYGGFDVRLDQVTIDSTYGYAFAASGPPNLSPNVSDIKVSLHRCLLRNNRVGVRMTIVPCLDVLTCAPSSQSLFINDTLFEGGSETRGIGDAIRFSLKVTGRSLQKHFIDAKVILYNVTFQGIHNGVMYVTMQKNVKGLISIKNCKFINNSQFVYRLDNRATVGVEFPDEDPPKCLKENNRSKVFWNDTFQTPVTIENSIFENNVGISGALNFLNGNVTLRNCTFRNNEGLTLGGHVYLKTGYGSLSVVKSAFLQTRLNHISKTGQPGKVLRYGCFLYSDSTGPIIIRNSSFIAKANRKLYPVLAATKSTSIKTDATSTLQCPSKRRVKLESIKATEGFEFTEGSRTCWMKVNYVKLFCQECNDKFYCLETGLPKRLKFSKGLKCLNCPYGASCEDGNVRAKENFWGLKVKRRPPTMQFFPCPLEYCSSSRHSSYRGYNACHGKRTGVLCGRCSDGYSEELYSTSCRKKDNCSDHWFWVATAIYVIVFSVYFIFKPPVYSELYKQTLWFKKKPKSVNVQSTPEEEDNKSHDSGYLKIVFYFYQVAELMMIRSPEKTLHMVPIIPPIMAIFNFQVKKLNGGIGCPFPGLTVVTKELFMCSKFLGTLLSIGFIYALHRSASKLRFISSPSLTLYLGVVLETLLLGYEGLADTTLKLMHCVPIEKDWRLFLDGNIECWQWWQYLLIAFAVSFIIPLVLVLFWGSLMLAKNKVTAKEFLIACALPLPCLLLWLFRQFRKTDDEQLLYAGNEDHAEEIKQVLHGPFRKASTGDYGTLYWESVLTGRRLILLTIHTFTTDPLKRFVCLNCACVLMFVHHLTIRPFREQKANICEGLSLMSLTVICTFSLAEATYISEGIDPAGLIQNFFQALQWMEVIVLGLLPAMVCVLFGFAVLSQVIRLLYHCVKFLLYHTRYKYLFHQEISRNRELLVNWDPEEVHVLD